MGYTLTIATVRRVQPLLEELLASSEKNEERVWKTDDPGRLAHRLREAMVAAAVCATKDESCARLAILRERYTICAIVGAVKAEPRLRSLATRVEKSLHKLRLPEVENLTGAVGAAIVNDGVDEIHFPSVLLAGCSTEELVNFANWAHSALWFIVNNYDDGMTLTKSDPGEMKWQPSAPNT